MKNVNRMEKRNLIYIGLVALHLVLMAFLCAQKSDYHMDEILTFALSNNTAGKFPPIEYGMKYEGWGPYYNGIVVNDGEGFDFRTVWDNQTEDVHPVLYYILVHSVCSVFSNHFSMWFGIIVNLCSLIFIDILLFQLSKRIFESEVLGAIVTGFFGTSFLLINMMSFIRMYSLLMVFVLLISLVFLIYFDKEKDLKFYLWTFLIVLGGMLTQYFFVIYLFFLCVFMGIKMLIVERNIKATLIFSASILGGMATSVLVFPGMIKHIFMGHRGQESVQNLVSIDDLFSRVRDYAHIINSEISGGLLAIVVILLVVWLIYSIKNKYSLFDAKLMLIVSAIMYSLIVAKIAPIVHDRYISPVCPIIAIFVVYPVYKVICIVIHKWQKELLSVFLIVLNIFCLAQSDWATTEMYKNSDAINIARSNSGKAALCIGDSNWRNLHVANTLREYVGYYFEDSLNYKEFVDDYDDDLIVYIEGDVAYDEVVNELSECGNLSFLGEKEDTRIYSYIPKGDR